MKAILFSLMFLIGAHLVHAQSNYKAPYVSDNPPKHLVKFSYEDQGKITALDGTYIQLELQDRKFKNASMQDPFDVVLCIKNTSKHNVYIPRQIFCWFDSGFGSDKYYFSSSDTLLPGKTKKIPVHVRNNWREYFEKSGYIGLFISDSTEFRYRAKLTVHFVKSDTTVNYNR